MHVVAVRYDSLLNQIGRDVESAVKHGMASHNDELKVAVKKNDAELKMRQAENGIILAKMNLCQLIGMPLNAVIDVEEENNPDFLGLIDKNAQVTNRTEYELLDLKTRLAQEKVKLEQSEYRPQLGVMLNAGVMDGMEILGNKMFKHKPNLTVGATLKIPLFHAGETRQKVAAAKEELAQERLKQEDLAGKMNLDLQQQANIVDEARLELKLRKRNLEQCEENLRISRKSYSVGMETLSEVLTAQLLWQQAYAELVESRYQAKVKMMKWRKAAGRL
jgi:outer membrane protein TolC